MAGGWIPAARLPLSEALAWADAHLKGKVWEAYLQNHLAWCSALPAFVGGEPPEPPEPPED